MIFFRSESIIQLDTLNLTNSFRKNMSGRLLVARGRQIAAPTMLFRRLLDKSKFVGERMTKYIANILTGFRIFGSILLLFFPAFSLAFYITYILCGFSDMIDGTIARKTNSASRFGSQLDTIADFIFVVASLIKLLPAIHISVWLWIWGGVITMIKLGNILWGYISQKQFISMHTIMNKATGLALFLLPLTLSFVELKYTAIVVCFMATFSAIQEGYYILTNREPW